MTSTVNIDRLSTWVKYRKGLCTGCWAGCCTLPVEVSVADLIRLELVSEEEAATQSGKKISKRLIKEGVIRSFNSKSQIFTLEQRNGRDCIYLDSKIRRCTVYEKRPEVCRGFPIQLGPRPGFCPSIPVGVLYGKKQRI